MQFDYVFVGAGLQSALSLLALAARQPGARVALVERAPVGLGNHTWCFHADDVEPTMLPWLAPALAARWRQYRVKFPRYERVLPSPYCALTSASLAGALREALSRLEARELYGRAARALSAHEVQLEDGTRLEASLVVDARGPEAGTDAIGYQKFVGHELKLHSARTLDPVVMDASVTQYDGFRFFYLLPLAADRVLLEDTYYSHSPELDVRQVGQRVLEHAEALGLPIAGLVRSEHGVLPLPDRPVLADDNPSGPLRAGYRGGWYHPVTGYSFPLAVRMAAHLAERGPLHARGPELRQLIERYRRQARFLTWLNRLLFKALPDDVRRNALERFYSMPEAMVARFYAMNLTHGDCARLLCGRPPAGLSLSYALRNPPLRLP